MHTFLASSRFSVVKRKIRSAKHRIKWKLLSELFRLPAVQIERIATVLRSELSEPIMEDICMPPFVEDWQHDDLGTVLRIAKSVQPQLICEIGTAHGNLTANLLRNCPAARVVTVNAPAQLQTGPLESFVRSEVANA